MNIIINTSPNMLSLSRLYNIDIFFFAIAVVPFSINVKNYLFTLLFPLYSKNAIPSQKPPITIVMMRSFGSEKFGGIKTNKLIINISQSIFR